MHNKAIFALAGAFLAVAVVVVLSLQAQSDLEKLIIVQNPSGMETGGNSTSIPDIGQIQASHQTT